MWNINDIKNCSCVDVCLNRGISLKDNGLFWVGRIRNEKTNSFNIRKSNNMWIDRGTGLGGSVIDLVATLDDISSKEAWGVIANEFGIDHIKPVISSNGKSWTPLTDHQYKMVGVDFPERVSLNFKIDLTKHTIEQAEKWDKNYSMSLKELGVSNPNRHDELLNKRSTEKIMSLFKRYQDCLSNSAVDVKNFDDGYGKKAFEEMGLTLENEINSLSSLVKRGLVNDEGYYALEVDFAKDLKSEIEFKTSIKALMKDCLRWDMTELYEKVFNQDISEMSDEAIKGLYDLNKSYSENLDIILPLGREILIVQKDNANCMELEIKSLEKLEKEMIRLEDKMKEAVERGADSKTLDDIDHKRMNVSKKYEKAEKEIKGFESILKSSIAVMVGMEVVASAEQVEQSSMYYKLDDRGELTRNADPSLKSAPSFGTPEL